MEVAHLISSFFLYPFNPKISQPVLNSAAKTTNGVPKGVKKNGMNIKAMIHTIIDFFALLKPFTTGSIGTPAARYSSTRLIARA